MSQRLATALLAVVAFLTPNQAGLAEDDQAVDDRQVADAPNALEQARLADPLGFDANVFRGVGDVMKSGGDPANTGEQPPASPTPSVVREIARARLEWIDAVCGLRAQQRDKLQLALDLEGQRVAAEIDAERARYVGVRVNQQEKDRQRVTQECVQTQQRCRERLVNLFGVGSMFSKVLPTTLDSDQQTRLAAEEESRRSSLWHAIVAAEVLRWDDVLGLTQEQCERIETLLVRERPPLRVEMPGVFFYNALQFGPSLVYVALSQIDSARLEEVVSPRQATLLAEWARHGQAARPSIEAQGVSLGVLERVWK